MDEIEIWAESRGVYLFVDPANKQISFFYVSVESETLQIVLEFKGDTARVDVWSLETFDDEEVHFVREIPIDHLYEELDGLVLQAKRWLESRVPFE